MGCPAPGYPVNLDLLPLLGKLLLILSRRLHSQLVVGTVCSKWPQE